METAKKGLIRRNNRREEYKMSRNDERVKKVF